MASAELALLRLPAGATDPFVAPMAADRVPSEKNKLAFLGGAVPDKIASSLDGGVRVISSHNSEAAKVGQAHKKGPCRCSQ